jgi:hypothetical protein
MACSRSVALSARAFESRTGSVTLAACGAAWAVLVVAVIVSSLHLVR